MNRARAFRRVCNSLLLTQFPTTRRPLINQVTHFSPLSPCLPQGCQSDSIFALQKLYFSSKPNSLLQLLSTNDWSSELENELESLDPKLLTHETVIYVLRKIDKDPEMAWCFFNWVCERSGFRLSNSLYSVLLRMLVSTDSMKNFWITIKKMKEQGFYIDEETYLTILGIFRKKKMDSDSVALKHFYTRMLEESAMDSLVKDVTGVILSREWSDEVEKELGNIGIEITDNFVIRVLKDLRNYPLKALSFFRWIGKHGGYEYNSIVYNAIARVLGRTESITEFWNVVEEMKNAGHNIDIDTYTKISRHFLKCKLKEDAVKLYEFMMDGPFKPSIQDCCVLLRNISSSNDLDLNLVFRVQKKYEAVGNSLSKPVYDGIHRSLTSAGKFDEAEEIVKVMRNSGFEPDNITYSQLVFGLCKARRFEEACKVLDDMEASECPPDIMTWTILIQGHCAANQVDTALVCFAKMMEKECGADADLLDVLLNGFLSQNRIDDAYTFLVEMVKKVRLVPWQATYKLMIEKLLGAKKLEEALNLLQLMKKHNHPPFPHPFVQHISKFGTVEDAVDFFKALTVKQYPSTSAYLHVFRSFFDEGRHSEAKDLLYKCPHHIRKHPEICKLFGSVESGSAAA